jgi:hypothetical protein
MHLPDEEVVRAHIVAQEKHCPAHLKECRRFAEHLFAVFHDLEASFGDLHRAGRVAVRAWDQGTEMARHLDVMADTAARIYFCDAASPGNAAVTRTPTGYSASTSRSRPAYPSTQPATSPASNPNSSGDLDRLADQAAEDLFQALPAFEE